ncbi:MAG: DUF4430 domain-containing protein [Clostridia bacterium]|nr:DUF4430 domain-containing protein [Clostridia bacterium]
MGIKEKLKTNRKRKIALVVVGLAVLGMVAASLSTIEPKDAKLPNEAPKQEKVKVEKEEVTPKEVKIDNSKDPTASNEGNVKLKPKEAQKVTVTLEIRCDEVPGKEGEVILAPTTYTGTTENTVFDALNTLCRNNDIQIEYRYQQMFESYYVEGIQYIYEFDYGDMSGWIYTVNGWSPNYGCSSYYLHDGDVIVWKYTCTGEEM